MKHHVLHIGERDFIIANRRAARLEDIQMHGKPVMFRTATYKSKKSYDRNKEKRVVLFED